MKNIVFNVVMIFDFRGREISKNGGFTSFDQSVRNHVAMCDLLMISLKPIGYKLRIATNDIQYFKSLSHSDCVNDYLDFISLPCSERIPIGLEFYGSLHKLELANFLSSRPEAEYNFIIDNDCVMLKDFGFNINQYINSNIPLIYNITNQISPSFGLDSIKNDITLITKVETFGNWIGGEIIGGNSNFYKDISDIFYKYIDGFISIYSDLIQKSDENFYSILFDYYSSKGKSIGDLGLMNGFVRFWSVKTLHFPEHWLVVKNNSILHLPASKTFLSDYFKQLEIKIFDRNNFFNQYEEYLNKNKYKIKINFFTEKNKFKQKILKILFNK